MPMPKSIFTDDDGDPWLPVATLSALILENTGCPGPGHRGLTTRANSAVLSPPMERRREFWGVKRSKLPELIEKLRMLGLLGGIDRCALNATMQTYWRARQAGLDHDAAANCAMQEIESGVGAAPSTTRQLQAEIAA